MLGTLTLRDRLMFKRSIVFQELEISCKCWWSFAYLHINSTLHITYLHINSTLHIEGRYTTVHMCVLAYEYMNIYGHKKSLIDPLEQRI